MSNHVLRITVALVMFGAGSLSGQYVTQDWKLHNVGSVIQLVTNRGILNKLGTDYRGLINCEYPPNSYVEHMGGVGWYLGAITPEGDTLVSVTKTWNSSDEFLGYSDAPWDTVWTIYPGDTVDIGGENEIYLPGYVPLSDQDIVTRYNDYNELSLQITSHTPLYLDAVQVSYAWSSPPLDKILVFNYYITSTEYDLEQVYLGNFVDGNVGYRTGSGFAFGNDDFSTYHSRYRMGIAHDGPGGEDGGEYSPLGMMVVPSDRKPDSELRWTWLNGATSVIPGRDEDKYLQMSSGEIMEDQERPEGTHFINCWGPYDLPRGDTLDFKLIEILGDDAEEVLANAEVADWLVEQDFRVPSPPPTPPLTVKASSNTVTLDWTPTDEINPEEYTDPNRADSARKPFEGYRVYKSTQSQVGPWTLLAQFDVEGNPFELNTGLSHRFVDTGLLNNVEYYYTVTAFSKPDTVSGFPSQETSLIGAARTVVPGTAPPETVEEVAVVPNPYRGDIDYNSYNPPWEKPPRTRERWMEQDRRVQFINLPAHCVIRIYTLSGDLITTLQHNDPERGYEDWNLTSSVGQAISSGIYVFTVEKTGPDASAGERQVGKFVIIK